MGIDKREFFKESNAVEGVYSDDALEKQLEAWRYIKYKEELTHEVFKQVHRIILEDRQPDIAGEYRGCNLVYPPDTPDHKKVKHYMDRLLDRPRPETPLEALKFHLCAEQIHPHADGNGRTYRMVYMWHMDMMGEEPLVFREEDKLGYYALFNTGEKLWRTDYL